MCVPRKVMPQVRHKDLEELLCFLDQEHGIEAHTMDLPLNSLRMVQCLHDSKAGHNPLLRTKRLLIAGDFSIIDGNGRYLMYQEESIHAPVPAFFFNKPFVEVTMAILTFPKAYTYFEHPERMMRETP